MKTKCLGILFLFILVLPCKAQETTPGQLLQLSKKSLELKEFRKAESLVKKGLERVGTSSGSTEISQRLHLQLVNIYLESNSIDKAEKELGKLLAKPTLDKMNPLLRLQLFVLQTAVYKLHGNIKEVRLFAQKSIVEAMKIPGDQIDEDIGTLLILLLQEAGMIDESLIFYKKMLSDLPGDSKHSPLYTILAARACAKDGQNGKAKLLISKAEKLESNIKRAKPDEQREYWKYKSQTFFMLEDWDQASRALQNAIRKDSLAHFKTPEDSSFCTLLRGRKQLDKSINCLKAVIKANEREYGQQSPLLLTPLMNLATVLIEKKELVEAESVLKRVFALDAKLNKKEDEDIAYQYFLLGWIQKEKGNHQAVHNLEKALKITKKISPPARLVTLKELRSVLSQIKSKEK